MYAPRDQDQHLISVRKISIRKLCEITRNSDDFSFSNRFPETLGFMCAIHGYYMYLGLMKVLFRYEVSKPQVIHFCTVIDRAGI